MKTSCFACRVPADSPAVLKSWTRITLGPESDKRIIQRVEGYQKEPRQLDICGPCSALIVSWLLVERADVVRDSCPDCEGDYEDDGEEQPWRSAEEQNEIYSLYSLDHLITANRRLGKPIAVDDAIRTLIKKSEEEK